MKLNEQWMEKLNYLLQQFSRPSLSSSDEWNTISCTSREDLVQWQLSSCPVSPVHIINTSGSEGNQKLIYLSETAFEQQVQSGVKLFQPEITPIDVIANLIDSVVLELGLYRNAPNPKLHCGIITDHNIELIRHKIHTVPATVLIGFTTQVYEVLRTMESVSAIRAMFLTGGPLTPEFRALLQHKSSRCIIHHFYASTEFGVMGKQTATPGVFEHITDHLLLEVRTSDGTISQEGVGDLLVTDCSNFSTPFIRYQLGDRVELRLREEKQYITVLGRSDANIKIGGDVCAQTTLVHIVGSILGHLYFNIIVTHSKETLQDVLTIVMGDDDGEKKSLLIERLSSTYAVEVKVVSTSQPLQKTTSGKVIPLIDKRVTHSL